MQLSLKLFHNILFFLTVSFLIKEYRPLFENIGLGTQDKTIEDKFFEYEVKIFSIIFSNRQAKLNCLNLHSIRSN
jgi:hypothetical protein